MITITPYLIFSGNCRKAMAFYQQCLGGTLSLQSVEDSPMAAQWPASMQKGILHASLVNDSMMLLGSDMTGPEGLTNGNTVAVSLTCNNPAEAETFFNCLSTGGKATRPLHEFFNGYIAALTDPFGIDWLIYCPKQTQQPAETIQYQTNRNN